MLANFGIFSQMAFTVDIRPVFCRRLQDADLADTAVSGAGDADFFKLEKPTTPSVTPL